MLLFNISKTIGVGNLKPYGEKGEQGIKFIAELNTLSSHFVKVYMDIHMHKHAHTNTH